jgi:hypothetical protein
LEKKSIQSENNARLRYDAEVELLWARVNALEKRVNESKMMMRRPGSDEYEKLVDIVCDHEDRLNTLGG